MRLIEADALIMALDERYNQKSGIVPNNLAECFVQVEKLIKEQSTAYDVDKVSERLRLELGLADKEKERCAKENPLQFDEAKGYARGVAVALEIIKSGSIE